MHFSLYSNFGHSLTVKSLPVAPPTRKCESHIAANQLWLARECNPRQLAEHVPDP